MRERDWFQQREATTTTTMMVVAAATGGGSKYKEEKSTDELMKLQFLAAGVDMSDDKLNQIVKLC